MWLFCFKSILDICSILCRFYGILAILIEDCSCFIFPFNWFILQGKPVSFYSFSSCVPPSFQNKGKNTTGSLLFSPGNTKLGVCFELLRFQFWNVLLRPFSTNFLPDFFLVQVSASSFSLADVGSTWKFCSAFFVNG